MRYEGSFPAVPLAIGAIRGDMIELARSCGLDERGISEVALAVSEAATNAIVHAYGGGPGEIRVAADADDGELTIVVADDGEGLAPRDDSPGLGMGLPVIASLTRRLAVASEGAGTTVEMVFACPAADGRS